MLKFNLILGLFGLFALANGAAEFTYSCPSCQFELNEESNVCYHFSLSKTTWEFARQDCLTLGGHLVKIEDKTENNYIKDRMNKESYWIGLNDRAIDDEFVYTDVSDTTAPWFNWNLFEPSGTSFFTQESCVEVKNGGWNDLNCDDGLRFVCEIEAEKKLTCPEGFVFNPNDVEDVNSCYKFGGEKVPYDAALAACKEIEGASLFVPSTKAENDFIAEQIGTDYWLDLTDVAAEGTFVSSSGAAPAFTNWDNDEPSNGGFFVSGTENCVIAFESGKGQGTWNDDKCDNKFDYVCKVTP